MDKVLVEMTINEAERLRENLMYGAGLPLGMAKDITWKINKALDEAYYPDPDDSGRGGFSRQCKLGKEK